MSFMQFDTLRSVPHLVHAIIGNEYNLAPHTGPGHDQAIVHRHEICSKLGVPFAWLTCPQQVHGVNIVRVDRRNAGAGHDGRDSAIPDCDGLITDAPNVPLMAFSADCCLLAIVDPVVHAIGLIHAGWRGVAENGAALLVQEMCKVYNASPTRMRAVLAPAAQVCCYEISDELADTLSGSACCGRDVLVRRGPKYHLDMHGALVKQLASSHVPVEQIERSADCTICGKNYFSYRREGAETGRNALLIGWTA